MECMQQPISEWLDDLASSTPAPGGGAAAALIAATGAALLGMVTNLTIGNPRYADQEPLMTAARQKAEALRQRALQLAAADAEAFSAVIAAYKLPRGTAEEQEHRSSAVQRALVAAARVPLDLAGVAEQIIRQAESLLEGANANVISDVAVAADAARAALTSAAVNVQINIAALQDATVAATLGRELDGHLGAVAVADRVSAAVLERIEASRRSK
jgi:formiminotetrahydrofolate cyclodeaminase